MKNGVVKVVITLTVTMMGYTLSSSTPSVVPSVAMINENSPICVRLKPLSIAILSGWPVASMPVVPNTIIPTITTTDSSVIVPAYCTITSGLTIMPTEMKKTAPKRSFTGPTMRSMRSASGVPARIEPMTKAPSASEKPLSTENIAIRKHSPMEMMSIISSLMTRLKRRKMVGITNTPTTNQMMRKNPNLRMLLSISPPSTVLLIAIDERSTIITTAKRSSTMSTANTPGTKRR